MVTAILFLFIYFLVYAAKMNVIVLPSLPPVLLHAQNVRKLTTSLSHLGRWGLQILKLLSSGVDLQRCSWCSWICCPLLVRERHTALFNVFEWHVFLFFFSYFLLLCSRNSHLRASRLVIHGLVKKTSKCFCFVFLPIYPYFHWFFFKFILKQGLKIHFFDKNVAVPCQ